MHSEKISVSDLMNTKVQSLNAIKCVNAKVVNNTNPIYKRFIYSVPYTIYSF